MGYKNALISNWFLLAFVSLTFILTQYQFFLFEMQQVGCESEFTCQSQ